MTLALRLLTADDAAVASLAASYEPFTLSGRRVFADVVRRAAPHDPWLIFRDDVVVGLYALRPDERLFGGWTTTAYLAPEFRRQGVNTVLKQATLAAVRAADVPFSVYTRTTNAVSRTALLRMFPEAAVSLVDESVRYDLAPVPTVPL